MLISSTIDILNPTQNAQKFYTYLARPDWFMERFIPAFEDHRKQYNGKILLALNGGKVAGCCYYEQKPPVFHNAEQIPIFGWIQADTSEIMSALIEKASHLAHAAGFPFIRGPVNLPKVFGGWGYIENGFDERLLINTAWNTRETAEHMAEIEPVSTTTYYNYKMHTFNFGCESDMPHVRIYSPKISQMRRDSVLMTKLGQFIGDNFSMALPDTSHVDQQLKKILTLLSQVDNPEAYYQIGENTENGEIAGLIVHIPNIFDLWQERYGTVCSANHDTFILGKAYRRGSFSQHFWHHSQVKLLDAGIEEIVNSYMWENRECEKYH